MKPQMKSSIIAFAVGVLFCVAAILFSSFLPTLTGSTNADTINPDIAKRYVPGASIKEIYRIGLAPGDMLLESIQELIERENITDGAVLSGIGSLKECRYHYPATTDFPADDKFVTLKEPLELLSMQGIIADGVPHIHFSISRPGQAMGGHLEEGCKVLYLAEIVIASYDGPPMTRRPSEYGVNMLQKK